VKFEIRVLKVVLLLLFILAPSAHGSNSSGQIKSLAVSPDGNSKLVC
jgi:hypothetical protein